MEVTMKLGYFSKKREIPTSWADILNDQKLFRKLFPFFMLGLKKTELIALILNAVLRIDVSRSKLVPDTDKARLFELFENFDVAEIPRITRNMYPHIQKGLKRYYGPGDIYEQFETWEFALAENYFNEYVATNDIDSLNKFMAVMYRPRAWRRNKVGDIRIKFDDSRILSGAKAFASVPMPPKIAAVMWFKFERDRIAKMHAHTYKKRQSGDGGTWNDTILSMSKVGEEDKVAKTLVSVVLRRIENDNKRFDKLNQPKDETE